LRPAAGLRFDVPEVEVGFVLAGDGVEPVALCVRFRIAKGAGFRGSGISRGMMPDASSLVLQFDDSVCR